LDMWAIGNLNVEGKGEKETLFHIMPESIRLKACVTKETMVLSMQGLKFPACVPR
jgi:hypothetical protein